MSNIIFDFDGTIIDSFDYVLSFLEPRSKRASKLNRQEKLALRGMPMHQMARELGVAWWRWPKLFIQGRRAMCDSIDKIEPCGELPKIIRRLYDDGHKLFIVSSNSVHNIEVFLTWHALNIEFVKIYGNVGWRGKTHVLKKVCRHNKLAKAETFYIGDEARDVRSAHKAGINSVAVSWGYNTATVLKNRQPDHLVRHPSKLMEIFSKSTPSCYNKLDEQLETAEPALSTWPGGRV